MAWQLYEPIWKAALPSREKLVTLRIADHVNAEAYAAFLRGERPLPGASPGIRSIAATCGLTKQGASNIIDRLLAADCGLSVQDGAGTRPRTYFLDVQKLASYRCVPPARTRRVPPRRTLRVPRDGTEGAADQAVYCPTPSTLVSHPVSASVLPGGTKPSEPDLEPCKPAEPTAAHAAADTQEAQRGIPFKVYAAIATKALNQSLREDETDELGNVTEWFKKFCAGQRLSYDGDIARKAIDAAVFARDKAKSEFISKLRTVASPLRAVGGRA